MKHEIGHHDCKILTSKKIFVEHLFKSFLEEPPSYIRDSWVLQIVFHEVRILIKHELIENINYFLCIFIWFIDIITHSIILGLLLQIMRQNVVDFRAKQGILEQWITYNIFGVPTHHQLRVYSKDFERVIDIHQ